MEKMQSVPLSREEYLSKTMEELNTHWKNITKEAQLAGIQGSRREWIGAQFGRWSEYQQEGHQRQIDLGLEIDPKWERELERFVRLAMVQRFLQGTRFDGGPVDGLMGTRTRAGVSRFQAAWNSTYSDDQIVVDGIPGLQTIARLSRADGLVRPTEAIETQEDLAA